jgi:hypothetical protein
MSGGATTTALTAGTLTFDLHVDGITLNGVPGLASLFQLVTGSVSGDGTQTVREQLLVNGTTVLDSGVITPDATTGVFSFGPQAGSFNIGTSPFAVDLVFTWNVGAGTGTRSLNLSSDARGSLTAVPEPATVASALVGLASFGLYRLRRRKAAVA